MNYQNPEHHRPEITEVETPESDAEWELLVWDTVEEFIKTAKCQSGSGGSGLHLSPFTFPGGDAEEGDDPYPLCAVKHNSTEYVRKDVAVFPPRFKEICTNCMRGFKHFHRTGMAPSRSNMYHPRAERERRRANRFDVDKHLAKIQSQ